MHALIVSHHFLPHVGGLEVLVDYEIRALVAAGHEVTLVTSNGTGNAQNPEYPDSVRIVRVKAWHILERWFRLPYPIFSPTLIATLWRELNKSDVVHIHGFMFLSSLAAVILSRLRGKQVILTDHGGIQQFDSKLKSIFARIGAETVGRFTACFSHRLVAYNTRITRLLERLTHRHDSALFLPNPVDANLFCPASEQRRQELRSEFQWHAHRKKVLFVGRLTPEKGIPQLLECASKDYDLVFCGSGDPTLLGPLPRSGVEYLPPRPQTELVKLYQAADVLLAPSKAREGFPLVVQEALACGLKVVLGYDEGFEPYRSIPRLTFCSADPVAIRKAIANAIGSTEMRHSIDAGTDFFPSPDLWIRKLYEGLV